MVMRNENIMTLLDPLLPLLRIRVSSCTKTSLVSCNQWANELVFSNIADSLVVTFCCPWSGIEFWPVDLKMLVNENKERPPKLTYNIPLPYMNLKHHAPTTNQNMMKIRTGRTAASGKRLVNAPTNTKNMLKAKI